MDRQIVSLRNERDPSAWIQTHLPGLKFRAITSLDSQTFMILLTKSDARKLQEYLSRDLFPPFARRYMTDTKTYAPGFLFTLKDSHYEEDLPTLLKGYQSLSRCENLERVDRDFIQQEINAVDNRMSH